MKKNKSGKKKRKGYEDYSHHGHRNPIAPMMMFSPNLANQIAMPFGARLPKYYQGGGYIGTGYDSGGWLSLGGLPGYGIAKNNSRSYKAGRFDTGRNFNNYGRRTTSQGAPSFGGYGRNTYATNRSSTIGTSRKARATSRGSAAPRKSTGSVITGAGGPRFSGYYMAGGNLRPRLYRHGFTRQGNVPNHYMMGGFTDRLYDYGYGGDMMYRTAYPNTGIMPKQHLTYMSGGSYGLGYVPQGGYGHEKKKNFKRKHNKFGAYYMKGGAMGRAHANRELKRRDRFVDEYMKGGKIDRETSTYYPAEGDFSHNQDITRHDTYVGDGRNQHLAGVTAQDANYSRYQQGGVIYNNKMYPRNKRVQDYSNKLLGRMREPFSTYVGIFPSEEFQNSGKSREDYSKELKRRNKALFRHARNLYNDGEMTEEYHKKIENKNNMYMKGGYMDGMQDITPFDMMQQGGQMMPEVQGEPQQEQSIDPSTQHMAALAEGGAEQVMNQEQAQMEQQVMALAQAAASGDPQAMQKLVQLVGEQDAQMIIQEMQSQGQQQAPGMMPPGGQPMPQGEMIPQGEMMPPQMMMGGTMKKKKKKKRKPAYKKGGYTRHSHKSAFDKMFTKSSIKTSQIK